MSITGSGLLEGSDHTIVTISDKWMVEALKHYFRKRGGRISGKKADLLERFEFGSDGAISNHRQ